MQEQAHCKAVDVVCLDFSKAFDTVFHSILAAKLRKCGLDDQVVRWAGNGLEGRRQSCGQWDGVEWESILGCSRKVSMSREVLLLLCTALVTTSGVLHPAVGPSVQGQELLEKVQRRATREWSISLTRRG